MSGPATVRVIALDVDRFRGSRAGLLRVLRDAAPDVALVHRAPAHALSGHRLGALASDVGMVVTAGGRPSAGAVVLTTLRMEPAAVAAHTGDGGGLVLVDLRLTSGSRLRVGTVHARGDDTDQAGLAAHLIGLLGPSDGTPTVVSGPLPGTAAGDVLATRLADLTPGGAATAPADAPLRRPLGLLGRDVDATAVPLPGEPGRRPALLARVLPSRPVLVDVTLA